MDEGTSDQASPGRGRSGWSLRLWLLAAAVLALLAVGTGAIATFATRAVVADSTYELTARLRPAQTDSQRLLTAYVDEETGQRGFILTGDERLLRPYRLGERQVQQLEIRLERLLAEEPAAIGTLRRVEAAGQTWNTHVAREISVVRSRGPGSLREVSVQRQDEAIFDRLRSALDDLRGQVNRLVDAEVARLSSAQRNVDTAMVVALGLAIAALACTVGLLWFALTRPLTRLLEQLDGVAQGEYGHGIDVRGPEEIQRIAEAAETMRVSIVDRSTVLAATQRELGVQNERQRLAADLHDTTIQRVFALGLKLSALASQHTAIAGTLNSLIEEADEIIRQLRRMIFELEGGRSSGQGAVPDRAGHAGRPVAGEPDAGEPDAGRAVSGEAVSGEAVSGDQVAGDRASG